MDKPLARDRYGKPTWKVWGLNEATRPVHVSTTPRHLYARCGSCDVNNRTPYKARQKQAVGYQGVSLNPKGSIIVVFHCRWLSGTDAGLMAFLSGECLRVNYNGRLHKTCKSWWQSSGSDGSGSAMVISKEP